MREASPDFFEVLFRQQQPDYLWIGCADSRVPANEITGLLPGELFVHRNVANLVIHTDLNCLSVIQYAVEVLRVGHIIVCGHLGCGGIRAVLEGEKMGLIDNWLRHVQDTAGKHRALLDSARTDEARQDLLCRLNVIEQVCNLVSTPIVRDAWDRGQALSLHGWIYDIRDGILHDLGLCVTRPDEIGAFYRKAVGEVSGAGDA